MRKKKFSSLLERGMKILDENLTKVSKKLFQGQQHLNYMTPTGSL